MTLEVRCPAKINLFLSVGPIDASGYHPINTLFQAVSIFDKLSITPANETTVTSNWSDLPEDNTLTKTLRLVREYINLPHWHIHLEKNIPSESGLGGGSSDAAGLLRGINALVEGLEPRNLQEIAAAVGMDVPFFLTGGFAKGTGYGDRIEPLPNRERQWLVVTKPDIGTSTQIAYAKLDAIPREFFQEGENYNDFERVAPCECLELLERLLIHGAKKANLTGSGSAVYGLFIDEQQACEAAQKLKQESSNWVQVAHTLTREESLWMSSF